MSSRWTEHGLQGKQQVSDNLGSEVMNFTWHVTSVYIYYYLLAGLSIIIQVLYEYLLWVLASTKTATQTLEDPCKQVSQIHECIYLWVFPWFNSQVPMSDMDSCHALTRLGWAMSSRSSHGWPSTWIHPIWHLPGQNIHVTTTAACKNMEHMPNARQLGWLAVGCS